MSAPDRAQSASWTLIEALNVLAGARSLERTLLTLEERIGAVQWRLANLRNRAQDDWAAARERVCAIVEQEPELIGPTLVGIAGGVTDRIESAVQAVEREAAALVERAGGRAP